jgi:hypothetical protein
VEETSVVAAPVGNNTVLDVDGCRDVVLLDVEVLGREEFVLYADGRAQEALGITGNSQVQAYDCPFQGGDASGYDCIFFYDCAQTGGPGLRSDPGCFVFLSGCMVRGGDGVATGDGFTGGECSRGGAGWANSGTGFALASELVGGAPGAYFSSPCASPGAGYTGIVAQLPGRALAFEVASPLRDGSAATLSFEGPPLAPVFLSSSSSPLAVWLPIASGVLLTGSPRTFEFMGVTDASGRLSVAYPLDALAPGSEARHLFLQASYFTMVPSDFPAPVGKTRHVPRTFVLGRGSVLVQLASGF